MKYAWVKDGKVAQVKDMRKDFDPADIAHKMDWRPIVQLPGTSYNQSIEVLEDVYTVFPDHVDALGTPRAMDKHEQASYDVKAEHRRLIGVVNSPGDVSPQDIKAILKRVLYELL